MADSAQDRNLPASQRKIDKARADGQVAMALTDLNNLFGAIDTLRIPVEYLAELFTAGEVGPVRASLQRLAAMRSYMRAANLGEEFDESIPEAVRLSGDEIEAMYRLLAIAKYQDRYVIPSGAGSDAHRLDAIATGCSLDGDGGPGMTAFDAMARLTSLSLMPPTAPCTTCTRTSSVLSLTSDCAGVPLCSASVPV